MSKTTPSAIGKNVRLSRILKAGKGVIFAFDHGFEHGPNDFEGKRADPRVLMRLAVDAKFDAVMAMPGIAEATWEIWAGKVPMIVKLTGKTSLRPLKYQFLQYKVGLVEEAMAMGADAVAATIYWGAEREELMVERFVRLSAECNRFGMPMLVLSYPRGPAIKSQDDPDVVRYAARASSEVGADLIKTHYTGSKESFQRVVEASTVPVMMSGGPKETRSIDFLRVVESVMEAGGAGVVVGRNVFQSRQFMPLVGALRAIVHEGFNAKRAEEKFGIKG